jgi:hypothetical protein
VERLIGQGQAGGRLPGDVGLQPAHGLAVGEAFEGLEDHDGGYVIGGHRGSATTAREQILEQLVGEHLLPLLGQEGVNRAFAEQVPAQGGGVQQRSVRAGGTLACPIGSHPRRNRESARA